MVNLHPVLRRLARVSAGTVAVLIGAALALFSATPAAGDAAVGYVRLAHLSPDTPKVDVYLDKVGDSTFAEQVFHQLFAGANPDH